VWQSRLCGKKPTPKFPPSHKLDQRPRARRHLCRHPDAKQTEKRKAADGTCLHGFRRQSSFYDARGNSLSVSSSNMRKNHLSRIQQPSHTGSRGNAPGAGCGAAEALRRVQGQCPWRGGAGAAEAPAKDPGSAEPSAPAFMISFRISFHPSATSRGSLP